jgi:hypothetical protein
VRPPRAARGLTRARSRSTEASGRGSDGWRAGVFRFGGRDGGAPNDGPAWQRRPSGLEENAALDQRDGRRIAAGAEAGAATRVVTSAAMRRVGCSAGMVLRVALIRGGIGGPRNSRMSVVVHCARMEGHRFFLYHEGPGREQCGDGAPTPLPLHAQLCFAENRSVDRPQRCTFYAVTRARSASPRYWESA